MCIPSQGKLLSTVVAGYWSTVNSLGRLMSTVVAGYSPTVHCVEYIGHCCGNVYTYMYIPTIHGISTALILYCVINRLLYEIVCRVYILCSLQECV